MSIEIAPNFQDAAKSAISELSRQNLTEIDISGFAGFFVTTKKDSLDAVMLEKIIVDNADYYVCQKTR